MDRLAAIYQYRYPDTYVEPESQLKGTYTWHVGDTQDANSPLKPFHMNALGDMWTANTVRNWTSFGYSYPELISNPSNTTLTETLNKLYKPQIQGLDSSNATGGAATNITVKATDWNCQVKMPADIQVSYSVRGFLGEPNADPEQWATDPNYIGQVASTSSPRMSSNVSFTSNIRLTEKLFQKYKSGELKSLDDAAVAAYLEKNFHWRIQALDYTEIPRSSPPPGLNVTVFNVPIEIPESDTEVPKWSGTKAFKPEIKGNPPKYMSGKPLAGNADGWNATSGVWQWGSKPEDAAGDVSVVPSSSVSSDPTTPVTTAVGTVTPGPGEAVQVSTLPNGQKVTEIVTVVVTVQEGAEQAETSAVASATTEAEISTPVTTPVGTVTPGAGEAVEIVTLESGEKITRVVTVVQEVTVFLPAPTA